MPVVAVMLIAASLSADGAEANVAGFGAGVAGFNKGGPVRRFAGGGPVYGPNVNRDVIDAKLTPGEYVFSKPAVDKVGMSFMDWFHGILTGRMRGGVYGPRRMYQTGGAVASSSGSSGGSPSVGLAVMVPDENTARSILQGGRETFIRFIEEHSVQLGLDDPTRQAIDQIVDTSL